MSHCNSMSSAYCPDAAPTSTHSNTRQYVSSPMRWMSCVRQQTVSSTKYLRNWAEMSDVQHDTLIHYLHASRPTVPIRLQYNTIQYNIRTSNINWHEWN